MLWVLWLGCTGTSQMSTCENGAPEENQLCIQKVVQESIAQEKEYTWMVEKCQQLQISSLVEECSFLVADEYQLIEGSALEVCATTGGFQEDCQRHAAARHVEMKLFPILHNALPLKVMPRIYEIVGQYLPDEVAQPMSRDMMLRYAASQVHPPFSSRSCQGLGLDLCAQVYILRSLGTRSQIQDEPDWKAFCGRSLSIEDTKNWGWMSWTQDQSTAQIIQTALHQLCQRSQ